MNSQGTLLIAAQVCSPHIQGQGMQDFFFYSQQLEIPWIPISLTNASLFSRRSPFPSQLP